MVSVYNMLYESPCISRVLHIAIARQCTVM